MQLVLAAIEPEMREPSSFKTGFMSTQTKFKNCAPCNFYIEKGVLSSKNTWEDIGKRLRTLRVFYRNVCDDYRFDSLFHNIAGIAYEKRQVYSCAVLMLTLLTRSMVFSPFVCRSDAFDRNYKHLLGMMDRVAISSYSQAILIGALSDKLFELHNYSNLDILPKGRTDEHKNAPLKVETVGDFKRELAGAINTLEHYQLSLQEQAPRQLIPISLENLSKEYNPYSKGGESLE
jgi:hypothetical protein